MESKFGIVSSSENENGVQISDSNLLYEEAELPWKMIQIGENKVNIPIINLDIMKGGDEAILAVVAEIVRDSCMKHGFFIVSDHGVDQNLINDTYQEFDNIFKLPLLMKVGSMRYPWGYLGGHAWRFSSNLPWKESFTFQYKHYDESNSQIVEFFKSVLDDDHQQTGLVCQKYCDAMKKLSGLILELLAISLSVDPLHYQNFFKDAEAMMRCSSYPSNIGVKVGTLGVGPHCDPSSITILFQDQVGGLEVLIDKIWYEIPHIPNTFVISIGDTFKVLTNGIYKSCSHRVMTNKEMERKTLAFYLCPKGDKVLRAPKNILGKEEPNIYPDFTLSQYFEFTQKHQYMVDPETLMKFVSWLCASSPPNI
ncbi:unnamed protein product [Lathyrus sativus]|nr:unnamed protein product [Lathyrus sativus]